jgi:hypothetical protein
MTKFKKDDLVRVHATRFNAPNGGKDKNGRTFAENWAKEGNGEWCYGRVSFVYKRKGRQAQKYRIHYDERTTMESLEDHMEAAPEGEEDGEDDSTDDIEYYESAIEDQEDAPPGNEEDGEEGDPTSVDVADSDSESEGEGTVTVGGVLYQVGKKRKLEHEPPFNSDTIGMGESITIADLTWTRIEGLPEDVRTEPHLPTTFKTNLFNDQTREIDAYQNRAEALTPRF